MARETHRLVRKIGAVIHDIPVDSDPRAAAVIAPPPEERPIRLRRHAMTILVVLAATYALQWARPLLVPVLFGVLISYALDPIVQRLEQWRVKRALAAPLVFLATLGAVLALTYAFSYQLTAVIDRLPSAAQELRQALQLRGGGAQGPVAKVQQAADELQKLSGANAPAPRSKIPTVAIEKKAFDLGDYLWSESLSVTTMLADTIVVLFLALY